MTTTPHKEQGWEERFDEKYRSFELCNEVSKTDRDRLKSFIQQEIDTAYERAATEVEGVKNTEFVGDILGALGLPSPQASLSELLELEKIKAANAALSQAAERIRSFKSK